MIPHDGNQQKLENTKQNKIVLKNTYVFFFPGETLRGEKIENQACPFPLLVLATGEPAKIRLT